MDRLNYILIVIAMVFSTGVRAEVIEFSEEELPSETVLPVFDHLKVVRNRKVTLSKKIEVGAGFGMNMTEALYNNLNFNFTGNYHFNEIHSANITGIFNLDGLSSTGEELKAGRGIQPKTFDPSLAPHPEYIILANYQFNAYYGKMSLSKYKVIRLHMYGQAGLGTVSFGDSNSIALDVGIGQKFYFTDKLSFKMDLKMIGYPGPDPASIPLATGGTKLPTDAFKDENSFHIYLTGGLTYLL